MRYEYAVSEIIGAVILIGVVMGGIGILGVILLSTPPPEETPKASISTYCVQCDPYDTYEIIMYHGGGESLDRKNTRFYLQTEDGKLIQIDEPKYVYDSTPEDCMFSYIGDSSLSGVENWSTSDKWVSGQTLRFRFTSDSTPKTFDIRYYPFRSTMVRTEFKNDIRESPCVRDYDPVRCDPERELKPILISPTEDNITGCNPTGCSGNKCQAVFTYQTKRYQEIQVHEVKDGKPWNYFAGSDTYPLGTNMTFSSSDAGKETFKVNFSSSVVWWLNRSKSAKAKCG